MMDEIRYIAVTCIETGEVIAFIDFESNKVICCSEGIGLRIGYSEPEIKEENGKFLMEL